MPAESIPIFRLQLLQDSCGVAAVAATWIAQQRTVMDSATELGRARAFTADTTVLFLTVLMFDVYGTSGRLEGWISVSDEERKPAPGQSVQGGKRESQILARLRWWQYRRNNPKKT